MKTEVVKLSQVALNDENPRTIHEDKFEKLVNSILVLPKMLDLRPVVVDNTMLALGGNMRTRALRAIAKLKISDIKDRLCYMADYLSKTEIEREALIKYWEAWLKKPTVQIVRADQLTEQEKQQFIIKDNVSFGQWDFDRLANSWDESLLGDWGMDVWNMSPMGFGPLNTPSESSQASQPSTPDPSEEDIPVTPNDGSANIYEMKIKKPVYEPSGNSVEVSDIYDLKKTSFLIENIDKADIPEEIKTFLRCAAYRHVVFDYGKIADYYSTASKEVQDLMEQSALVVIDYDQAIADGFVFMSKAIAEAYKMDAQEAGNDQTEEEDAADE